MLEHSVEKLHFFVEFIIVQKSNICEKLAYPVFSDGKIGDLPKHINSKVVGNAQSWR